MRTVFWIVFVLAFLVPSAWYANLYFEWSPRPSQAQVDALDVIASAPQPSGKADAFAALWFLKSDIPDIEREAWLVRDVAAWELQEIAANAVDETSEFSPPSSAKFREVAVPGGDWPFCESWADTCLSRVRADPAGARAAMAKYEAYARNVAELARYDHARFPYPPSLRAPIPEVGSPSTVAFTGAALVAIDEGAIAGLEATCGVANTWRRLRTGTDHLVLDLIGVNQISTAAQLAAEILAEAPRDTRWPESCAMAFAPLRPHELVRCEDYAREFHSAMQASELPDLTVKGMKAVNWRHVAARLAPVYAYMCSVPAASGSRRLASGPSPECGDLEKALDPIGCMLTRMGEPDFRSYRDRVLDLDGRLATLRAAVWLRDQPGDPAEAFATRPADLRTPEHDVTIDPGASTLTLHAIDKSPARAIWTIPFAGRR